MAKWFGRRLYSLPAREPIISFTFDDFPRSALSTAGAMLGEAGILGTYYVSFGLTGQVTPTGEIFIPEDLRVLQAQGHELGCHTFDHCPAWETASSRYLKSVERNRTALQAHLPGAAFETHSYPISYPRPRTKRNIATQFKACRGGGQVMNSGTVDLNYLSSYFLEQSRDDWGSVEAVISHTIQQRGWLIFSTHDICECPTRFGCSPQFFRKVVKCCRDSGARLLGVSAALEYLGLPASITRHAV